MRRVAVHFSDLGIPPDGILGVSTDIHRIVAEPPKQLHDLHKGMQLEIGAKISLEPLAGLEPATTSFTQTRPLFALGRG